MAKKIVDMRSRPAFLHDFYGATPGTKEYEVVKWINRRVGSKNDEHFVRSKSIHGFVDEVRETGITKAVLVGRDTPAIRITNDQIKPGSVLALVPDDWLATDRSFASPALTRAAYLQHLVRRLRAPRGAPPSGASWS